MTEPRLILPSISPAAPGALYEQIVEGIKREITDGRITGGAPLPSFRALAQDLMVSVITVKRAYDELERAGIIFRRQGLGTFVTPEAADRSREIKLDQARSLFVEGLREAAEAGLNPAEISDLFHQLAKNTRHTYAK